MGRGRQKEGSCEHCRHDVVRNCTVCVYPAKDGGCLYDAIQTLVLTGSQVGLDVETMIELMESGMSTQELLEYIEVRQQIKKATSLRHQ